MKPSEMATNQVIGEAVQILNEKHAEEVAKWAQDSLSNQDVHLKQALEEMDKVSNFLQNRENILGSELTKHGEVAEQMEVHVRNAKSLLDGKDPSATFEGVGRTAPEDYLINETAVQSKFINGINNNLDSVLEHMSKYEYFGRDGSYYHIPKDTHETIMRILEGENPEGLNGRTINSIIDKVKQIETQSGQPFQNVVQPGQSNYADVQLGKAQETVDNHKETIRKENEVKKDEIQKEAAAKQGPSLEGAAKAGLIGATIGGGFSLAFGIYKKTKEGKKVFEFTSDDWKEIGVDFTKGSAKGGITGSAIYGLTNYTTMGAPMASAFVSATFGVGKLIADYQKGKLNGDEFIAHGMVTCVESGMVALGAVAGQALIPIPIVGTLIGSFAASTLMSILRKQMDEDSRVFQQKLSSIYNEAMAKVEAEYQKIVEEIMNHFKKLGDLAEAAFDISLNIDVRFQNSQKLAQAYGVPEEEILMTEEDIDSFFLE